MSEVAQEVAQLKSKLHEASRELAQAQEQARQAADKLISDPTPENQADRNAASDRAELISLQIEKAKRDLAAAEQRAHEDAIAERITRHTVEAMGPAGEAHRRLREHVYGAAAEIAEIMGYRNQTRATCRDLRAHGYTDFPPQLGIRVDEELIRRMEALVQAYRGALKEVNDQVSVLLPGREVV
jgi:hypothetical protein